jgi:DNA (cytosine-5)-methyltransferase 1
LTTNQVLKQAFPGVMCAEDVAAISELPKDTELVVAGFPCIDVSRAGLRKGIDGSVSYNISVMYGECLGLF